MFVLSHFSLPNGGFRLTSFPHARTILIDYLLKQFSSTLNVLVNDTTSELYTRLLKDSSPFPLLHYKTGKPLPQLDLNSGIELISLTVPTSNCIASFLPLITLQHILINIYIYIFHNIYLYYVMCFVRSLFCLLRDYTDAFGRTPHAPRWLPV